MTKKESIDLLESALNIALAGFGGFLAGLSISRRGNNVASIASYSGRSLNNTIKHELPILFASSCSTFALIIEAVRSISPVSFVTGMSPIDRSTLPVSLNDKHINMLTSISDYTLGGTLGGGLFSQVALSARTKTAAKLMRKNKLPSFLGNKNRIGGVVPGGVLGFIAGASLFCIGELQEIIEESEPKQSSEESRLYVESDANDLEEDKSQNEEDGEKVLSAKELKNRIETLEKKKKEQ